MKRLSAILLCIVLLLGLCACGGKAANSSAPAAPMPSSAPAAASSAPAYDSGYYESADSAPMESAEAEKGESGLLTVITRNDALSDKMIYSASARVETTDFEGSVQKTYDLVERFGGFFEDSYIRGADYRSEYYGYQTYREAQFTIRVPKDNYTGLTESLESLGSVTSLQSTAVNISPQYTDAQARLSVYEAEEQRLIAMMDKADTVEDLITIESRLADVRYEIEAITSTLRNWQNEIDYSTVTLTIKEGEEIRERVEYQRTFGEELRDGFLSTLKATGRFFKNLFRWIVVNLPVLVVLAVVVFLLVLLIRALRRRALRRRTEEWGAETPPAKVKKEKKRKGRGRKNAEPTLPESDQPPEPPAE